MTFLNPAILWGLVALAVPIIIHFFNLQRPKEVLFSNVAFVKEVKKSVVKRLQFKQWLLLLARLLAITLLVLAFANPVILDEDKAMLKGNRSVAIVVDNSYSMTAGNEKGNYIQQAQSLSRNIIGAYTNQDEFLLMSTSDLQLNASFGEQAEIMETAKALSIKQNIRPHTEVLGFRDQIFSNASNSTQELYFLGDFQRSTSLADSQTVQIDDTSRIIKYIPLATREQKNVYVASHKILSQIIEKGKPVQISMVLVNGGTSSIKELGVRVLLDEKVAAIASKSLEANSSEEIEITFTPSTSGWLAGYIELDDYPIEFDNRRYFTLYVPEAEKVLVVEGSKSPNVRVLYRDLFSQFESKIISSRNLSGEQLNDYRSVVMVGVNEISSGLSEKLKNFLSDGGSMMWFPGTNLNLDQANAFLQGISLGKMSALTSLQTGSKATGVDLEHPIFDGVFTQNQQNRKFDAPNVFKYHPFQLNNALIHNTILSLGNKAPILVETKVGKGLLYTFTTFPSDSWTDFHLKTTFAPILFRATQIMNQTQNVQSGQEIGYFEPKSIRTSKEDLIKLKGEGELELIPEQYIQGGASVLNFQKLDLKEGNYQIIQGEEVLEQISFNISDRESKLDFANSDKLRERLDQTGYPSIKVLLPEVDSITERIQVEKEGIPLWKYFIIFALLFLVAEILILKIGKSSS